MGEELDAILHGRKFKRMMEHTFENVRKKYDLKQIEIEILFYLCRKPDASACDIYRSLSLNKGQVSQALDHLCKNGYLRSHIDSEDRRYVSYEMLEKGISFMEEGSAIREALQSRLFAGVTEEELEVLERITEKINRNIEGIVENLP